MGTLHRSMGTLPLYGDYWFNSKPSRQCRVVAVCVWSHKRSLPCSCDIMTNESESVTFAIYTSCCSSIFYCWCCCSKRAKHLPPPAASTLKHTDFVCWEWISKNVHIYLWQYWNVNLHMLIAYTDSVSTACKARAARPSLFARCNTSHFYTEAP